MWWVGTRKKRMALSLQIQRNLWLVHLCWVLEWGEGVSPLKILRRKSDNLTWPPAENVPQAEEPHTFMDGIWPWASHPGLLALSGDRHSDFPCLRHCTCIPEAAQQPERDGDMNTTGRTFKNALSPTSLQARAAHKFHMGPQWTLAEWPSLLWLLWRMCTEASELSVWGQAECQGTGGFCSQDKIMLTAVAQASSLMQSSLAFQL